jgi:thiosulfate dehydrogenase [quinone] large subunit
MHQERPDLQFEGSARPLLVGLLAVQIFLGYEWLISGLAKVLAGDFASGLANTLSDQTKDLTGPYKSFLDGVVIPNGQLFGYLVMAGELALGLVLIGAALLWVVRWSHLGFAGRQVILGLIVLGGVVAIFMNINFHIAGGASHPWLIAADPNGEGVDLDSLMPIIQTIISAVAFVFLRRLRSTRTATAPRPEAVAAARS